MVLPCENGRPDPLRSFVRHRRGARRPLGPRSDGRQAPRAGRDGSVHRALPQRADGGLDEVAVRAIEERGAYHRDLARAKRDRARRDRVAGEAHPGARGADPRLHGQVGPRGHLPSLQAQAPDARDDRARAGPRAARDPHPRAAAGRRPDDGGGAPSWTRRRRSPTPRRPSPARATSSPRGSPKTSRCEPACARSSRTKASSSASPSRTRSGRPTKFETYYGFRGDLEDHPVAPLPRDKAGRDRGRAQIARRDRPRQDARPAARPGGAVGQLAVRGRASRRRRPTR